MLRSMSSTFGVVIALVLVVFTLSRWQLTGPHSWPHSSTFARSVHSPQTDPYSDSDDVYSNEDEDASDELDANLQPVRDRDSGVTKQEQSQRIDIHTNPVECESTKEQGTDTAPTPTPDPEQSGVPIVGQFVSRADDPRVKTPNWSQLKSVINPKNPAGTSLGDVMPLLAEGWIPPEDILHFRRLTRHAIYPPNTVNPGPHLQGADRYWSNFPKEPGLFEWPEPDVYEFVFRLHDAYLLSKTVVADQKYMFGNYGGFKGDADNRRREGPPEKVLYYDKLIHGINEYSFAYYHFNAEIATRLYLCRDIIRKNPDVGVLIWDSTQKFKQTVLKWLGVRPHQIVNWMSGKTLYAKELYYARPSMFGNPSSEAFQGLRSLFVPRELALRQRNRIIVIDRRGGSRSFQNAGKVIDVFKAFFKDTVYEVDVFAKVKSMEDTRNRFKRAALVFGNSGAGLVNLMFSPRTTIVLENTFQKYRNLCHYATAMALGLEYWHIQGRDGTDASSSFDPNWDHLQRSLEQIYPRLILSLGQQPPKTVK